MESIDPLSDGLWIFARAELLWICASIWASSRSETFIGTNRSLKIQSELEPPGDRSI